MFVVSTYSTAKGYTSIVNTVVIECLQEQTPYLTKC